ncbi:replicative DNA helicase [Streptomyces sp. NPDC021100]|uniref:replicative DNA helicase n=1 Tax=Streptomyces sp. NPDC021100 TaxID=3365114 RepID=UPI00378F1C23
MAETESGPTSPPHDLPAEKAVLRAVLRSPEALADIAELLTEEDFYRGGHALIYTAALAVYARGEAADPTSVGAELAKQEQLADAGGTVYLHTLAADPAAPGTWTEAAERVRAAAVLRRLQVATAHIDNLVAEATPDNLDQIIDTAHAEVYAATLRDRTRIPPSYPLADVLEGALDEVEAASSRTDPTGIPTGFQDLDVLTGGLYPGQLVVIAGRPAMGTSTLVLNFLRCAAIQHGLPAALFTLESRRTDIALRLLSAEARVALHHLRSGRMSEDAWQRLAQRLPGVASAPLHLQDHPYGNFTELRAHCRRLHRQHDLRLIAVDDLQLLNYGPRPLGSRYEEVSEIARGLKLLAKELDIPVIAASHLNRGPEQRTDKRPLLSDLRDSGALEDNADLVILLHRDDAYEKGSLRAGEADLIVAKHRYGPTATLTVAHQGHYGRFVNVAPE